jgi:DNA repair exonuclease SbcCD nuclease subunit
MTWRKLRIGELGDVHLLHNKTSTEHILKNLYKAFPDNAETGELDLIIIAGDLFDRLTTYPDTNIALIRRWMFMFLNMCKRRDIVVRILEGTPSHDWKQSVHFVTENEVAGIGCDIKWVESLSIEHIERFGINVLYVPDEWKHETDDVWKDVCKELHEKGLTQVDFTVLHGAFNYQLPAHVPVPTHIPERYMEITKYFVFGGHIHKRSQYGNILAAGSFDRLTHGEEEDKGHYRVAVDRDNLDHEIRFIVNEGSKLYKSVDCTGLNLEDSLTKIDNLINTMPIDSHVRVIAEKGAPILVGFKEVTDRYRLHWLTQKTVGGEKINREAVSAIITPFTPAAITPDNIVEMVMKRVRERTDDPVLIAATQELLNGQVLPSPS